MCIRDRLYSKMHEGYKLLKEKNKCVVNLSGGKYLWVACEQWENHKMPSKGSNYFLCNEKCTGFAFWISFINYMNWSDLTSLSLCAFREEQKQDTLNNSVKLMGKMKHLLVLNLSDNNLSVMFINSLLSTSLKQSLSCLILNYITVNNLIFFRDIIISAVPKTNIKHFAAKYVPLPDMLKKLKESEELTLSRLEYLEICCEVENANDKKMEEIMLSLIHISEPTRPLYISYAVFCLKKKKKK
eukprot:TRINITY_DN7616_c0_g1_i2.p1 TRINITY_DN7616_c0_g1~~TRINITY_DN7616_c0_g1_i2.p1  ORF type:complete len:242 (+),score=54.42 TRINITY_DN7616_c0_g1_i2:68-793(+)